MALDTTRSLTGQEVVVLGGNKDDDLSDLATPANLGLGTNGNISSWMASCTPNISLPSQANTSLGAGTNAVRSEQPVGLLSVSFSIEWIVNDDVVKNVTQMVTENRLGQYLYPLQVIIGVAASNNQAYRGLGHYTEFVPNTAAESLISGTSTFMLTHSFSQFLTTAQLN